MGDLNYDGDSGNSGTGIVPRKRFQPPVLPMPAVDPNEQPGAQPDGPPNPFEKALAMGTALGNSSPSPAPAALGAPPVGEKPTPTLGASPEASATVAQGTPGITPKPFFSAAERGIQRPWLRKLAEIGDVAGSVMMPGITNNIPGTRANENIAQNRELAQQKEQAETAEKTAQAAHQNAEAAAAGKPKTGATPEEVTLHDLMTGENGQPRVNPDTGKPYSYLEAYSAVKQSASDTKAPKEGETPLGEKVTQANKMLEQRWQVRHPGQPLSPTYTLPPNATQKDYDRIDKALEAEERANGTKAQQDTANEMRKQTYALLQQAHADTHTAAVQKQKDALTKQVAPLQGTLDEAQHAHEMQKMADAGNAEADVDLALSFFKVMRSGGQGIRFTRQEQDLILGARNSAGDLNAMAQKVVGQGQKFTPEQRKQIVDVIDSHAKAAQSAMDRIQGGGKDANEPARPANVPEGYVYKDGAKGKGWYKP